MTAATAYEDVCSARILYCLVFKGNGMEIYCTNMQVKYFTLKLCNQVECH